MTGSSTQETAGEMPRTAGAERTDGNVPGTAVGPSVPEPAEAGAAEPDAHDDSRDEPDDEPDEKVESASAAVPLQSLTPRYEHGAPRDVPAAARGGGEGPEQPQHRAHGPVWGRQVERPGQVRGEAPQGDAAAGHLHARSWRAG